MFGVQINFKDGSTDWVDPCTDDPVEKNNNLIVSNAYYDYSYNLDDIDNWHKYDLCAECGHDTRTLGCTKEECIEP